MKFFTKSLFAVLAIGVLAGGVARVYGCGYGSWTDSLVVAALANDQMKAVHAVQQLRSYDRRAAQQERLSATR